MNPRLLSVAVGALCAVAALYYRDEIMTKATNVFALWRPPEKYAEAIRASEDKHDIPRDMLARLLYQESRYREDIITGRVRSSAGALGIAQLMPATAADLGVDPLDPFASINAAGAYLRKRYNSTGTWTEALAAYNWGIGNVQRKGIESAPTETRNYYTQILGDVNSYHGTAYA